MSQNKFDIEVTVYGMEDHADEESKRHVFL
jgi:hypothetical protein